MTYTPLIPLLALMTLGSGPTMTKEKADYIFTNGLIYTVDGKNTRASAMAVAGGKVLATGSDSEIGQRFEAAQTTDLHGQFVYPGFVDAHCHFYGYALGLQYVDLNGCKSFDEVLDRIRPGSGDSPERWIVGRGWDQNLWPRKEFPDNTRLNELYPDRPVVLMRVDGHALLANRAALEKAGIGTGNKYGPEQAEVRAGTLTGILRENAADAMREAIPQPAGAELRELIGRAAKACHNAGLTTVGDAGLTYPEVVLLDSLQRSGFLRMNIYAMLTPTQENITHYVTKGPVHTDRMTISSIKVYADGSLGSRSALLKKPYADNPSTSGIQVTSTDSIKDLCKIAFDNNYQVNTHCIGDSAARLVLDIYGEFLKGKNDRRWRIEHAQVVDPADDFLFGRYSVIPSVQATHATSDMRWAGDRLGQERMRGAYAYHDLMLQNGWIANGTDFPIEQISPLLTFYAAVARRDLNGWPEQGFQPENALSRDEALRSVTSWAAHACFMDRVGSLEPGKDADFVILDRDIMTAPTEQLPATRVVATFLRGERFVQK